MISLRKISAPLLKTAYQNYVNLRLKNLNPLEKEPQSPRSRIFFYNFLYLKNDNAQLSY